MDPSSSNNFASFAYNLINNEQLIRKESGLKNTATNIYDDEANLKQNTNDEIIPLLQSIRGKIITSPTNHFIDKESSNKTQIAAQNLYESIKNKEFENAYLDFSKHCLDINFIEIFSKIVQEQIELLFKFYEYMIFLDEDGLKVDAVTLMILDNLIDEEFIEEAMELSCLVARRHIIYEPFFYDVLNLFCNKNLPYRAIDLIEKYGNFIPTSMVGWRMTSSRNFRKMNMLKAVILWHLNSQAVDIHVVMEAKAKMDLIDEILPAFKNTCYAFISYELNKRGFNAEANEFL